MTKILSLLSQDKLKKAKASKIDLTLDSVGGASSTDAGAGSTLKRASAVLAERFGLLCRIPHGGDQCCDREADAGRSHDANNSSGYAESQV